MKQKRVWLMCGIPGSGKSTWVKNHLTTDPGVWCSRDQVRFSLIHEQKHYFSREDEVFDIWINSIKEAIADESVENVYIDATHLNDKSRNRVLSQLNLENVQLCAVNFHVPLEECLRRNNLRQGLEKVPPSIIRRMHFSFSPVIPEDERFSEVINILE